MFHKYQEEITVRSIPYPFKAMMAICSDLDETPNKEVYYQSMKFLNTKEETSMGKGVGLEVGNTIYFDMPEGQFSYWNTDDSGRQMIQGLIKSGHIDCLHSYGDFADNRFKIKGALDELKKHGCAIKVWIDHAIAPSNFGPDIMQGEGDVAYSPVYHADLTLDYGVEYVWMGRVTSLVGQGVSPSFRGIWKNYNFPLLTLKTIVKEYIKRFLGFFGKEKYLMHSTNDLMHQVTLRDGKKVFEFLRCDPYWGGISVVDTAAGISKVLVEALLDKMVGRGGYSIFYTHLGKIQNKDEPFDSSARKSFKLLAQYELDGKIKVATTRRVLDYYRAVRESRLNVTDCSGYILVDVETELSLSQLAGLTIYVPDNVPVKLSVNGELCDIVKRNKKDYTGRESISIDWEELEFPIIPVV